MKKVPILVLAFNRPDHVVRSMEAIRTYQPERLYLECDGARTDKAGEDKAVASTRQAMIDAVDWPCEVFTLFRDKNLGCAEAVNDAITWFFEHEEYGIICEDDVVLGQDFFLLCEELLPRYKDQQQIMEISARNEASWKKESNTYSYSQCYYCWGWATWRRAWRLMDMNMEAITRRSPWYFVRRLGFIRGWMMYYYFKSGHRQLPNLGSWATRWYLSILDNDGLVIIPGVNLSLNIGMNDGTHYSGNHKDPFKGITIGNITWPIRHNDTFKVDCFLTILESLVFIKVRWYGLRRKLHI